MGKLVTIRLDVAPQTYDCLLRLIGGLWGDTADDVALQCLLMGLRELARDGFLETRHSVPKRDYTEKHITRPSRTVLVDDANTFIWCDQCDQRVSVQAATSCNSQFCKAKAA